MVKPRKPYGLKNAPPAVLHAPSGLPSKTAVPSLKRKMSMTVGLVSLGAAAVAGGVYYENRRAEQECRQQAAQRGLPADNCGRSNRSSGSHSSGHWSSWSSSSSSSSTSATTSHSGSTSGGHATFGGFGHSGSAHSGGS